MYYWIKTMAKSLPVLAHWRDANRDKDRPEDWRWARRWLRENLDQAKELQHGGLVHAEPLAIKPP